MAVRNFKGQGTDDIAAGLRSRASEQVLPRELHEAAFRKLVFLDNAHTLVDLMNWQGLRLEKLKGDRKGQYSVRINDRFRICFKWDGTDALDVEIVDYH